MLNRVKQKSLEVVSQISKSIKWLFPQLIKVSRITWNTLKKVTKKKWIAPVVSLIVFFSIFNFILYTSRPEALIHETQQEKEQLSQRLDIIQSIRSPSEWEFGQKDSAIHSQINELTTQLDTYSELDKAYLSKTRPHLFMGGLAYGYSVNPQYSETRTATEDGFSQGKLILESHKNFLEETQNFIEFNCEAYIIYQKSPSEEITVLIEQTNDALNTVSNEVYAAAADTLIEELRSFSTTLDSSAKETQNQACKKSQETLRAETVKALDSISQTYTNNTQQTILQLSQIQTQVIR